MIVATSWEWPLDRRPATSSARLLHRQAPWSVRRPDATHSVELTFTNTSTGVNAALIRQHLCGNRCRRRCALQRKGNLFEFGHCPSNLLANCVTVFAFCPGRDARVIDGPAHRPRIGSDLFGLLIRCRLIVLVGEFTTRRPENPVSTATAHSRASRRSGPRPSPR